MERAGISTIRHCVRSGSYQAAISSVSRRGVATASRHNSARATISSPTRAVSSSPHQAQRINFQQCLPSATTTSPHARAYSTNPSEPSPTTTTTPSTPTPTPTLLTPPSHLNEQEKDIWELLNHELAPTELEVQDVSGGCGSMYAIEVTSEMFRGLNMLKQQRLVNKVLGERVSKWHGVRLRTDVP